MFALCKNFIKVGEDLFRVIKTYPEERILNIDLAKQWLNATIVYKRDNILFFCEKINEAEIIN